MSQTHTVTATPNDEWTPNYTTVLIATHQSDEPSIIEDWYSALKDAKSADEKEREFDDVIAGLTARGWSIEIPRNCVGVSY